MVQDISTQRSLSTAGYKVTRVLLANDFALHLERSMSLYQIMKRVNLRPCMSHLKVVSVTPCPKVTWSVCSTSINQSIIHSFVSNAGGHWRYSILKVSTVLSKNIASSHHAVLDSSEINCFILFQIIIPSFPWSSPWASTQHILHKHLLYHPVVSHSFHFPQPLCLFLLHS